MKKREVKSKGEKERYKHLNAEFQRVVRRDKKAFLSDQCKEIEEDNRIKELYLIDKVPEKLWTEMCEVVQEAVIKTIPKKKKCKKAKCLFEEALQIAEKRRETKGKGEKERYTHLNAEFQRRARRDKKAFLSNQSLCIEENNRRNRRK